MAEATDQNASGVIVGDLEDAFLAVAGDYPVVVRGNVRNSLVLACDASTPALFRRRGWSRFAPLSRRIRDTWTFWVWRADVARTVGPVRVLFEDCTYVVRPPDADKDAR